MRRCCLFGVLVVAVGGAYLLGVLGVGQQGVFRFARWGVECLLFPDCLKTKPRLAGLAGLALASTAT